MDRTALIAAIREAAVSAAKPTPVDMGKLLGTLYVRPLTVGEVDVVDEAPADGDKSKGLARSACLLLCDESGERLFSPSNADDLALLQSLPWSMLEKVLTVGRQATETGNA